MTLENVEHEKAGDLAKGIFLKVCYLLVFILHMGFLTGIASGCPLSLVFLE